MNSGNANPDALPIFSNWGSGDSLLYVAICIGLFFVVLGAILASEWLSEQYRYWRLARREKRDRREHPEWYS